MFKVFGMEQFFKKNLVKQLKFISRGRGVIQNFFSVHDSYLLALIFF